MKCEPDEDDPFSFEGPEIISATGWDMINIELFPPKSAYI